MFSEIMSH